MIKLNYIQYPKPQDIEINRNYAMSALIENGSFESLLNEYKNQFNFTKLKTFSFTKEGFLGLLLELKGNIAISVGETQSVIDAGKLYESLGFTVTWIGLTQDGKVNLSGLKNTTIDFLFLSSYVMDTFVKTNLQEVKQFSSAKIISNATAHRDEQSDVIYFDNYKLNGFNTSGVLLFNEELFALLPIGQIDSIACKICFDALIKQKFNYELKVQFLEKITAKFKENLYFFVDSKETLEYTLHFGLKGIKARELIRTLALSEIFITNGEGCSLGLSKPSRIIQEMGYDELTSRNAISLSFVDDLTPNEIDDVVKIIYLKYLQIKSLS